MSLSPPKFCYLSKIMEQILEWVITFYQKDEIEMVILALLYQESHYLSSFFYENGFISIIYNLLSELDNDHSIL